LEGRRFGEGVDSLMDPNKWRIKKVHKVWRLYALGVDNWGGYSEAWARYDSGDF
jgi:hypothetical protein